MAQSATPHYELKMGEHGFDVVEIDTQKVVCTCPGIGEVQAVITALEAALRLKDLRMLGF